MKKLRFLFALLALSPLITSSVAFASPTSQLAVSHPGIYGLRHGTSTNWSGYAAETNLAAPQSGSVSRVSAQWVVPAVTCTRAATYSSIWVGIDGYSNNTVEQTGTEQDCTHGRPVYYAWYEMYPQASYKVNLSVHPNDTVSAVVRYNSRNSYTLTLSNLTTQRSYATTRSLAGTLRQSAEWVVEAPSSYFGVLPLADFGVTAITNASATINGLTSTISEPTWQNDPITMMTIDGTLPRATPSALSTDGSSFTTVWSHS